MSARALLRLSEVTRAFGGLLAVNNVTLSIGAGELVGLIGPNGAGKTTLLNLVSGLQKLKHGEISLDGTRLDGLPPHRIARLGVGRTFQVTRPFKGMTVLENALMGALFVRAAPMKEIAQRAEEVLGFLGLGDKKRWLVANLTLADVKRLELAKALAMDPKVLLLDEVMAGLNPREVDDVMRLVTEVNARGTTIVMIEHVMRAIMGICRRVVVLHHGEVIADGEPRAIADDQKVIQAYLGERFARRATGGHARP